MKMTDLVKKENQAMMDSMSGAPLGFEDDNESDMIIPRIKVINALSPERKDKLADEGDIVNSLTTEKLNGKVFIPVFKFNSNIEWKDRADGGGIHCHARDGKRGFKSDGTSMMCAQCRRNEFDNTKVGREAIPKCTKYINFFGFIQGERMPIILSFSKTNYNEGRKLYSLARVSMQNMWNHGYKLDSKLMAKGGNEWYNIIVTAAGPTSDEDRVFGMELFKTFRYSDLVYDLDDTNTSVSHASQEEIDSVEF
jgi:hypothetical protein